jgi:hypothetical protein
LHLFLVCFGSFDLLSACHIERMLCTVNILLIIERNVCHCSQYIFWNEKLRNNNFFAIFDNKALTLQGSDKGVMY